MRWGLFFIDNCKNIKIYYYLCQQNNQNHHDMRKLLPILFLFVTVISWAGNVTGSEALQKAKAFMDSQRATQSQRQMRLAAKSTQVSNKLTTAVKESYYVFNVGQNNGYVVVSADDRTPAILGYADEGTFNASNIPNNMKAWLQSYTDQLNYLESHPAAARAAATDYSAIRPLIKSTWDQGEPYNNKCPMDGDKRSLTGCLATVMAQILNYYQYPEKTTSTIPSYTTGTKGITVNEIPVTTIDWSNIKNNYNGNETAAQKNAIATLMQLCGASMEMDYTSYSSYAYMIPALNAFKNYFDYDTSLRHVNRIEFKASEWDELIYNELAQKRPVYYCGQSIGGGHAFVIDGYSKDGLFHVNWGWGGSCNGYFLLSILDPHSNTGSGASSSSDGYSYDQDAIIGIQPNTDNKPEWGVRMTSEGLYTNLSVVNKQGSYFPISLTATFYNRTGATQDFDHGIGVYDKDNKEVSAQKMNDGRFAESWGYNGITYNCNIPALPDGTYAITAISREKGTDTWYQNSRSFQYYITATINGNQMTLQNPTVDASGSVAVNGNMEVYSTQTAKATIKNNGTFFNNVVFLLVNGELKGGRHLEIAPGETADLDMNFTPEETGEHTIVFALKTWVFDDEQNQWMEQYNELANTTVTIKAAKTNELKLTNGMLLNADANGYIKSNVAKLRFKAQNAKTTSDYYDNIRVRVLQNSDGGNYYWDITSVEIPVRLGKLKSETFEVEVPLEVDGYYWFNISYKTDGYYLGNDLWDNRNINLIPFKVEIPAPTAEELGVEPITKTKTPSIVYDLQGRSIDNNLMKKGLYIKDGKKIIKR